MAHVFVSYVRENAEIVERLCKDLSERNVDVWLDRNDIKPGTRWKDSIREAIQQGAFFIACFSKEYEARSRSYMNEELTLAIEELRKHPPERNWFIPVMLSPSNVPNIQIGSGNSLLDIQYVALYEDWDKAVEQIVTVVKSELSETKVIDTKSIPNFENQFESSEQHFAGLIEKISKLLNNKDDGSGSSRGQVDPPWRSRDFNEDGNLCFLLMPFGEGWSDAVWKLIRKVAKKCGLQCQRADEKNGRVVMDDVWEGICKASIVIAELIGGNPNVTYEVGLADCLGKKIVLLAQGTNVPFDFLGQRLILYENSIEGAAILSEQLEVRLNALLGK